MALLYGKTSHGSIFVDDYDPRLHGPAQCPCCETQLRAKKGTKVTHHFAHVTKKQCEAWLDNGMTQWHKDWQLLAPPECREVRMVKDGEVHIADIQLPVSNVVVEIQHSPMSHEEAQRRERFYGDMVWLVDGMDLVKMLGQEGHVALLQGSKRWWLERGKPVIIHTQWGLFLVILSDFPKQKWLGLSLCVSPNMLKGNRFILRSFCQWLSSVNYTNVQTLAFRRDVIPTSPLSSYEARIVCDMRDMWNSGNENWRPPVHLTREWHIGGRLIHI